MPRKTLRARLELEENCESAHGGTEWSASHRPQCHRAQLRRRGNDNNRAPRSPCLGGAEFHCGVCAVRSTTRGGIKESGSWPRRADARGGNSKAP